MLTVMTGFSPTGLEEYGQNFLRSFDQYWPRDVNLLAFIEKEALIPRDGQRLLWTCPGVREFIEKHSKDLRKNGKEFVKGWRPKDENRGYSYRFDAVKFCRQCFIPETAAGECVDGDVLAWLDGDVMTFRSIPDNFVENLLGKSDVIYLGRKNTHAELGFWAIRMTQQTRQFLKDLAELWRSGRIFDLVEWHSAYAFEYMLDSYRERIAIKNLTPNGLGHVWFQSPLGKYTDHLKGERRKKLGRSPERVA